jgi:hypothetical protein
MAGLQAFSLQRSYHADGAIGDIEMLLEVKV